MVGKTDKRPKKSCSRLPSNFETRAKYAENRFRLGLLRRIFKDHIESCLRKAVDYLNGQCLCNRQPLLPCNPAALIRSSGRLLDVKLGNHCCPTTLLPWFPC